MRAILLGLLSVIFCSCATKAEPLGPCAQRSGTYVTDLTARSGNCGAQAEDISIVQSQPTAPPEGCKGLLQYSTDNCRVRLDYTCPAPTTGAGNTQHITGDVTWSDDASSATGLEQVDVLDSSGVALCHGTYDVNIARR